MAERGRCRNAGVRIRSRSRANPLRGAESRSLEQVSEVEVSGRRRTPEGHRRKEVRQNRGRWRGVGGRRAAVRRGASALSWRQHRKGLNPCQLPISGHPVQPGQRRRTPPEYRRSRIGDTRYSPSDIPALGRWPTARFDERPTRRPTRRFRVHHLLSPPTTSGPRTRGKPIQRMREGHAATSRTIRQMKPGATRVPPPPSARSTSDLGVSRIGTALIPASPKPRLPPGRRTHRRVTGKSREIDLSETAG
jgi:hypothetical protein